VLDSEGMDFKTQNHLWDETHRTFLPPILYSWCGLLVCVVPVDADYVDYVVNFTNNAIAKVRNAPRPALIVILLRKKNAEDLDGDDPFGGGG